MDWWTVDVFHLLLYHLLLINWNDFQVIFTKPYTLRSGRIMQGAYAANQIIDALLAFSDGMQIQVTSNL